MTRKGWTAGAVTAAAVLAATPAAGAIELAGDRLVAAGRLHLSADLSHTDGQPPPEDSARGANLGLSSNSSFLRFAGRHPLESEWGLEWQVEQGFRTDSSGGSWATRNTFLGLTHAAYGTVRLGHHNSPFKVHGSRWGVLSSTISDRRNILGAGARSGNVMNRRAANSVHYLNRFDALEVHMMYAAQGQSANDSGVDDNRRGALGAAAWYTVGPLEVSGALEHWFRLDIGGPDGRTDGRATGLRLAARHRVGSAGSVGVLFETIDTSDEDMAQLDRNAFGINGSYRLDSRNRIDGQLLYAGSHRGLGSSGAFNIGIGLTHRYDAQLELYAAATVTDNGRNAQYRLADGSHGDKIGTALGGTPKAVSAGAIFRF